MKDWIYIVDGIIRRLTLLQTKLAVAVAVTVTVPQDGAKANWWHGGQNFEANLVGSKSSGTATGLENILSRRKDLC